MEQKDLTHFEVEGNFAPEINAYNKYKKEYGNSWDYELRAILQDINKNPFSGGSKVIHIDKFNVDIVIRNLEVDDVSLNEVHELFKKHAYLEETDRIDVMLAVALSTKLDGVPLWLIIVGASGDMKSLQLDSLSEWEKTRQIIKLSSRTLVNGFPDKKKHPDLAPKLDGRLVVIKDFAPLLKMHPIEKTEVWGQLRELYDGNAGTCSGMGTDTYYKDLKITLIAGSTPAIDGQILIHQDLGTRELVYRTTGSINKTKSMDKCILNQKSEKEIRDSLRFVVKEFLNARTFKEIEVPESVKNRLMELALLVSYLRCPAELDGSGELRNSMSPEEPTRLIKQLIRLYICLKNLDDNYEDEKAIRIITHVAKSSVSPMRLKVYDYLVKNTSKLNKITTSKLAFLTGIGKKTAKREASSLEGLGLLGCQRIETRYPDVFIESWYALEKSDRLKF